MLVRFLWFIFLCLSTVSVAKAHELAPVLFNVYQQESNGYKLEWKESVIAVKRGQIQPVLPADCVTQGNVDSYVLSDAERKNGGGSSKGDSARVIKWLVLCEKGLQGRAITFAGL